MTEPFNMRLLSGKGHWYPKTLVFARTTRLPLFVRASRHGEFGELAHIVRVSSADELRSGFEAALERKNVRQWPVMFDGDISIRRLANLAGLDTID